jgi:energy-converting hydrogenase B subunit D
MLFLEYTLLFFLILAAVMAIRFEEEMISIIFLSIFSIILTSLYLIHQAPDVALAEVVIGTGLNTALFMSAICKIREGEKCRWRKEE